MTSTRTARGLLLVTNTFPYGRGEEFIENEFEALAKTFDHVVVIATKSQGAPQTRALPDNATAIRAEGGRPRGKTIPELLARGGWGALRARRLQLRSPKPLAADLLFEGQSRKAMAALLPQLDSLGLAGWDEVIIYSYWLHTTARIAELLRDALASRYPALEVVRLVSRAHRYDLYEDVAPFGHLPQRQSLISAMDDIYPISQQGADYLLRQYPASAPKLRLARLGTPDPHGRLVPQQAPLHVLTFSTSAPVKRLERVPGILAELAKRGLDVSWTHWGGGEPLAAIQRAAEAAIGADHVHCAGWVDHSEVLDRLKQGRWTCMLSVSANEGLPVSMMEACSVGLPVVATEVGGVAEIVVDGVSGRLLPADFSDSRAADVLAEFATMSPQDYQSLSNGARTIWETRYDVDANNQAFIAQLNR